MANRPTTSQHSTPAPRAAGTPANAPQVVSEERALALGLPGSGNGAPAAQLSPLNAAVGKSPVDFTVGPHDEAANLAARAADTVIETLLTAAHIGLALLDRDMSYRLWNNCLEELFGVPADALLGRAVADADGLRQLPDLIGELKRISESGDRTPVEREYPLPRTERGWVRVKLAPVFAIDGRFDGILVTCEPIDRERFAQNSLGALRQALESVGEMVFEIDQRGTVVDANDAARQRLGYDRDALKGLALDAIDVGLTRPGDSGFASLYDQLQTRGSYQADTRYKTRFGTEFAVETVLQRVVHDGREFILLLARDVGTRKQAESDLTESAERFRALFDESPVAALLLDSEFRLIGVNRAACETLGYEVDELLGKDPGTLLHPDDQPMLQHQRAEMRRGAMESEPAERRFMHRDGRVVWTKLSMRAIASESGLRHTLLVLENFTDRKIFEEQLQVALRDQQTLFETMSVGVAQTMSGKILLANREFAEMFGYSDGEVIGMPLWDLCIDRHHRAPNEVSGMPVVRSHQTTSGEVVLFRTDGEPVWCLVQARPIQAQEPGLEVLREAIYTFQNISEIKRQREALSRSLIELKEQGEELQSALAQQQLIFDTALVGLLFVRDSRPVRANSAMEDLLACEPGALVSQMQLFSHPTDHLLLANLSEHYQRINDTGATEFELHMFRRKGPPIWVAVQGRAVNPERPELGYIFAFVNVDERKRSERELRATLSELQLIFDNALVAVLYVANDLIVKANAATQQLFGYDARDWDELQIASLFATPADWEEIRELPLADVDAEELDTVDAEPEPGKDGGVSFERLMRRADGTTFWCAGYGRPIDPSAPDRGVILTLVDVDARRRSEEELRRVRNYLDLVVENLPVLVSVREAESGRFVSLNRAGETMTGLTREQVVGRTWGEIYARQFADLYAELDRKALSTGTQVDRPRDVMLRADGKRLTINQRVVPLFESEPGRSSAAGDANARYVMSIIDDLTEEVRAETALRETEARFRQFAENIDQLVFIMTGDFSSALYANPRYTALIGGPVSDLLDNPRNVMRHVHFEDVQTVTRALPRLIARMRRLMRSELTARIDHPMHGIRNISVRLSPVRMEDGAIRVFGIADDVTERTRAEQQKMEQIVKQRDVLVREVHHRIKNNLQGVAGLLQQTADARPDVADILSEAATQIHAIAQVHGLQIRSSGTLPVLGVAQGIFSTLSNMFGVEVRFEPPPPDLWRFGLPENEAVPLALVINELGTNAIKHRASRQDGIMVKVTTRPDGMELTIENPGALKEGFDLAQISASVSGLGLVKALLPRRGAKLVVERSGALVSTRLQLFPPAIREDSL
ncbi:MAG TPA: PAS domain S-box protein [Burkholderiaceae bacterium]|nr:PAS domain S-box protein [Burkholderiaceae bacterium]